MSENQDYEHVHIGDNDKKERMKIKVMTTCNLQKLGKICVTCQVNQPVDDANKDNLKGVQLLLVDNVHVQK